MRPCKHSWRFGNDVADVVRFFPQLNPSLQEQSKLTTVSVHVSLTLKFFCRTAFGIMLGYIAGVVFRSVAGGDSQFCEQNEAPHRLLSTHCVR